jgi:hypothetical protein
VVTSLTARPSRCKIGFGFGFYGPGKPLPPVARISRSGNGISSPGINTNQTPRHPSLSASPSLRAFANVELVRMAIETRKDQLERSIGMIKPRDNKAARSKERDPRWIEIEKFLAKPDGQTHFASFMRALDEDLLALDAPALECVRTRGGKLYRPRARRWRDDQSAGRRNRPPPADPEDRSPISKSCAASSGPIWPIAI